MNINVTDILCKNEWEYSTDPLEATSQGITLYLDGGVLYMKYPSREVINSSCGEILIGSGFDRTKFLNFSEIGKLDFKIVINKLALLRENQEKIKNAYLYLSVILKDEAFKTRFYISQHVNYLNLTDGMFSKPIYKRNEQLFRKYGNTFSKIQKYLWKDGFQLFVSQMFLYQIYTEFCRDYIENDFHSYNLEASGFLMESFGSMMYTQFEGTHSTHSELKIMEKMEKILENY